MTSAIDLSAIKALPVHERQQIVDEICLSIAEDSAGQEPDNEMKAELDRRIASYDADPTAVVPWEDVKAAAMRRVGR